MTTEPAGRPTAATAHALATDAKSEIEKHEAVCAERYKQIASDMSHMAEDMTKIGRNLGWCAATGVMTVIGLLGWVGAQWFQASVSDAKADRVARGDQAQQILFLRGQIDKLTAPHAGQSVVVTSPASATVSTVTPSTATAVDAMP